MPRPIEDSVVVITGASSGIGRASALEFARRGATVVLAARRAGALDEVARECESRGGRALAVPIDVSDASAVEGLARRAIETFGRIDVWLNNAAVTLFGRIDEVPLEDWRRVVETNLFGYVHGARAVIPYFREQGAGVLINIASVAGKVGQPYTSAYNASKFAIVGLSESLRQELRDVPGIHVVSILPPSIDTPIFQHAGNYTGWAIKPMPPVYDPQDVVEAIVEAVGSPRREIPIGGAGHMITWMHALAPGYAEWKMARKTEREHFQDRPAEPGPGNLFEPMPQYAMVRGGWREPSGSGSMVGLAAAGLAGLGLAWAAWTWLRPPRRTSRVRQALGLRS